VLAFTQPDLQTCFVNRFILDFALYRFIHLKEHISSFIHDHQTLGAHTNLIIFDSGLKMQLGVEAGSPSVTRIFWSHDGRRPFGWTCPMQCSHCLALKPWTPTHSRDKGPQTITHKCKNCKKEVVYRPLSGATTFATGGNKGLDERGTWWMQTVAI
jgi:hypothetical protein